MTERPCESCGSSRTGPEFATERGQVWRCRNCGFFFIPEPLTAEAQEARFYETIDEARYVGYFEPFRKGQYRDVLRRLAFPPGATHLDVGASYGWMVEVGLDLGLDSRGIEPGEAEVAREAVRKRIERTSLESYAARADHGQFALVTIWHALEHVRGPAEAAGLLRELVEPGGTLLVAVPNAEGWMYRLALLARKAAASPKLMTELWYFHNPNMHYSYFTPGALRALLERAGLRVESCFTIEAFDWRTIHRRVERPLPRALLQAAGPLLDLSGFTRRENLIVVATRA